MRRPLDGVKVIDVTQVMAGAHATMLLGDMGADVVKVERPGGGDDTRGMGAFTEHGESPAFMAVNRNKRGLVLDLATDQGAETLRRMVEQADMLVENFRPGTMERLGLGHEELLTLNPSLIYCSISGFGNTGPYRAEGGFDLVAQGMSGLMSMTGEPGRPPVKVGVPICDLNASMYAVYGVLSAYVHRLRTGEGQYVDTSLLESGIAYTIWETALFTAFGQIAEPTGSAHRLAAPYEALRTADGHLTIGAANPRSWERLCEALGRPDLRDNPRFVDGGSRMANRGDLHDVLETILVRDTTDAWVERLRASGVPCGPIYDVAKVYDDPHVQAREMLIDVEHPRAGSTKQIGPAVKLSATPAGVSRAAPVLGQHTREVLSSFGFTAEQIAELVDAGVAQCADDGESGGSTT